MGSMARNLTKYTDQFLTNFFKFLPYFGFLSAFAPPNPDFLKMRIFLKKVVRDVILLIMNISAKFESSTIIRKCVQICPNFLAKFAPWTPSTLSSVSTTFPWRLVPDVSKNVIKKNVFKMCFRTQIMQKRTLKIQ